MAFEVLPPKTYGHDPTNAREPERSNFLGVPPMDNSGLAPSGAKPDPEAVALVLGHYADEAAELHPAPAEHDHGHKHAPGHHEGKAKKTSANPDKAGPAHSDIFHTGLGDTIDQLAAKSPTLERELQTLHKLGWGISYGKEGQGTFSRRGRNIIMVDPHEKRDPLKLLRSLAHECGHAMYKPGGPVSMNGLDRQQYIDRNVDNNLKDEGEATINNLQVRQELLKAKQGDIGVSGEQSKKYMELYKKYPQAKDHDKLREEIVKVFAHGEHPSTTPELTYEQ